MAAPRVSYYLSIPPPPPLAALSHSPWRDRGMRGERLRASGTPRVSYLPREDVGWRLRASGTPRVSYLPREDVGWRLRASGTPHVRYLYQIRILDNGSARQLLSIYPPPPPPLAALGYSPRRINEVASGSARQVLRASATCRERM